MVLLHKTLQLVCFDRPGDTKPVEETTHHSAMSLVKLSMMFLINSTRKTRLESGFLGVWEDTKRVASLRKLGKHPRPQNVPMMSTAE